MMSDNAAKIERADRDKKNIYDVVVVGGGASGMAAAIAAARKGCRVALLEGQERIGRKLLATGNGRCNITNKELSAAHYRTDCPERLMGLLEKLGLEEISGFFADIGVPIFEERDGRMYPRGEAAAGVLDMLRFELERLGVRVYTETRVRKISSAKGAWCAVSEGSESNIEGKTMIIACGSPAGTQLGGCADGDMLAEKLGIKLIKRQPALCPLQSSSPLLKSLKGMRVHCMVTMYRKGKKVHSEYGELQFNEGVLSGICIFQMSSRIKNGSLDDVIISADTVPDMTEEKLAAELKTRQRRLKGLAVSDFLTGMLNKRVAYGVLKQAGIDSLSAKTEMLSADELENIARCMKALRFEITGLTGWKQAQTALGGIPLAEVGDDMNIRGRNGLYVCGEAVNCSGDCGGYNLHWAWISGITAGESAALYASKK